MRKSRVLASLILALGPINPAAGDAPPARPDLVLKEIVQGMPQGASQEIKVMTATIEAGGKTPFHTHRFPVTVYVQHGEFTLEMEGRPAVTLKAGDAMVEPPDLRMTGYNRSSTEPMRVVIFYVSDRDSPFLDLAKPVN